jgi:hypothetical protein
MDAFRDEHGMVVTAKAAFWHLAACVTGAALERKSTLRSALAWAPALLGGALAFALGRLAGELLRLWL